MRSYIKILREWSKLAKPNKLLLFFSFFMVVLVQVCFIVAPIYSAKTTVSITNGKYTETIIYLCVVFGILLLRKTFWHFNYKIYPYLVKSVYNRINQEFIEKSLNETGNHALMLLVLRKLEQYEQNERVFLKSATKFIPDVQ